MQKVKVIPVSGNDPHKERERLIREADERGKAELRREQVRFSHFSFDSYYFLTTAEDARARNAQEHGSRILGGRR